MNSLKKYFAIWGGGWYLVSLESSLNMWDNGVYVMLISWRHQLSYKFQILTFKYFCQILGVNSKILLDFPFVTWKNVGRALLQLFLLLANHMPASAWSDLSWNWDQRLWPEDRYLARIRTMARERGDNRETHKKTTDLPQHVSILCSRSPIQLSSSAMRAFTKARPFFASEQLATICC